MEDSYNVLFLVLTYVVPVTTMVVTYTSMGVVLWGSRGIGESTERQQNVLQAKRKVVRMLIAVVTLFSICWLPYNAYFVYMSHNPHVAYLDYIQHVYLAMYWLAMSHAMCNPVVYYCMNKRFRTYFRQVLCWCIPKPEATKAASANGRPVPFQTSWTDRQHTMRVSMCSHAVLLSKDRTISSPREAGGTTFISHPLHFSLFVFAKRTANHGPSLEPLLFVVGCITGTHLLADTEAQLSIHLPMPNVANVASLPRA
ncbi:hypothetical protein HPB50_013711 [Hyalomma asiaticum]|uniref:Uncharacterized protein n=1 Tax=Hyalomma asiaticum TaxID=266040 RepID=A0ACB7TK53_HYAAI|nr:hypothetical protein HPB50_013711 [Hyalomma asiaticum]